MTRLLCLSLLFLLTLSTSCLGQQFQSRIFDGTTTRADEFPWMAIIHFTQSQNMENSTVLCGASIISSDYVVTAASCFFGYHDFPFNFFVQVGIHNLSSANAPNQQNYRIRSVIVHPRYNFSTLTNDLALVRLLTPLSLSSPSVSAIELSNEAYLGERDLLVSGWGIVSQTNQSLGATLLQKRIVQEDVDCSCEKTVDPVTQFCTTGSLEFDVLVEIRSNRCFSRLRNVFT